MKSPPSLDGVLLETISTFTFDSSHPHEQRMLLRETPDAVFTESWCWLLWRRFRVTVPSSEVDSLRAKMHALEADENFSRDW
jgi:hypothetical protein